MFFIKFNLINFIILLWFNLVNICLLKYIICIIVYELNEFIIMYGIIYIYFFDGSLLLIIIYKNDKNIFMCSYRWYFFI